MMQIEIAFDDIQLRGRVRSGLGEEFDTTASVATTLLSEAGGNRWLLSDPPGYATEDLYRAALPRAPGERPPLVLSRIGLSAGLGRRLVDRQHYDYDYLAILTRALLTRLRGSASADIIDVALPTIGALFHPRSEEKAPKPGELTTFTPDNDRVRGSLALAFSAGGIRNIRVRWVHTVIRDILNDCPADPAQSYITPAQCESLARLANNTTANTPAIMIAELHLGGIVLVPLWRQRGDNALKARRKAIFVPLDLDCLLDAAFVNMKIGNYHKIQSPFERQAVRRAFLFSSSSREEPLEGRDRLSSYLYEALFRIIYARDGEGQRNDEYQDLMDRFVLTAPAAGQTPSITVLGLVLTGTLAAHRELGPALKGALNRLLTAPGEDPPQDLSFFDGLDRLAELAPIAKSLDVSVRPPFWTDVQLMQRGNVEPKIVSLGNPQRMTIEVAEEDADKPSFVIRATPSLANNMKSVDIAIHLDLQSYQLGRALEVEARIDQAEQITLQLYIDGAIYRGGFIQSGALPHRHLGQGRFAIFANPAHERFAGTVARVADDANGEAPWQFI